MYKRGVVFDWAEQEHWPGRHLGSFRSNTLSREVSINPVTLHAEFISADFILQKILQVHFLNVLDMSHEVQPLRSLRNDVSCL